MDRLDKKLCTVKQAATLERFGYSKAEASTMKFEQASLALDAIAKNGWKRPKEMPKFNPAPEASDVKDFQPSTIDDDVPF